MSGVPGMPETSATMFRNIQNTISIITLVTFLIVLDSAIITVGPHFGGQRGRSDRPGRSGQDDRTGTPPRFGYSIPQGTTYLL